MSHRKKMIVGRFFVCFVFFCQHVRHKFCLAFSFDCECVFKTEISWSALMFPDGTFMPNIRLLSSAYPSSLSSCLLLLSSNYGSLTLSSLNKGILLRWCPCQISYVNVADCPPLPTKLSCWSKLPAANSALMRLTTKVDHTFRCSNAPGQSCLKQ